MSKRRGEHGQTVPLMALVLVALGLLAVFVARVGGRTTEQAATRTAADAAALAGVRGGRDEADIYAAANGAQLVAYDEDDDEVIVRVKIGHSMASSRAVLALSEGGP
jgi:hypothetical protein